MRNLPILLALLASCAPDSGPSGTKPEARGSAPAEPAASPAPRPAGKILSFDAPSGWAKEEPSNNMRKAQYRVPDKEKQAKDAVFTLSTTRSWGPDSLQENVARWASQMGGAEPKVESIQGKCKVSLVDLSGDYRSDFEPEPIEHARMLVAVVETEEAPWFFKLVGPVETVGGWREEFVAMLKSAHP
jgi:hypothetical protein